MKATPRLPDLAPDIEKFLRIPVSVLVGENDTGRGARFNKSARIDRAQGQTRLARAERWVAAMTAAADGCGLDTPAHLQILLDRGQWAPRPPRLAISVRIILFVIIHLGGSTGR